MKAKTGKPTVADRLKKLETDVAVMREEIDDLATFDPSETLVTGRAANLKAALEGPFGWCARVESLREDIDSLLARKGVLDASAKDK